MRVRRTLAAVAGLALIPSLLGAVTTTAPQASATVVQRYTLPASGTIQVVGHGNGHGHGLSQYGAYGAALAGLSYDKILAFYYPGTTLTAKSPLPTLRVKLSGGYGWTCVQNKTGLSVVGSTKSLPTATTAKSLRFVPQQDASGQPVLWLRSFSNADCTGTRLDSYDVKGTTSSLYVTSKDDFVRLQLPGGHWTEYWGQLGAVRSGAGELTINKVDLDRYAQGVAPRESMASWGVTALSAQAVAARTYAEYEREHASTSSLYDICDTPSCQVYGGKAHSGSGGSWNDYPAAVASNKGQVVTYRGAVAFTQYSASNGGRTADGGEPYMIAKADPYDNTKSGDPYLSTTRTISVSSLAAAFGMKTATAIDITGRDGGSTGYVTSAVVYGTNAAGRPVSQAVTGYTLQNVFGLNSTYFTVTAAPPVAAQAPPPVGAQGAPPVVAQAAPPANLASYVTKVVQTLTGAAPSSSQLITDASKLVHGTAALAYTRSVAASSASLALQVRQVYDAVRRPVPSAATIAAKSAVIRAHGYQYLETNQFASPGYYRAVGGTPAKWVRAVYRSGLVYGATPSTATVKRFVTKLRHGQSRKTVLRTILRSTPVQRHVAKVSGKSVLGRNLTSTETTRWMKTYVKSGYAPAQLLAAGLATAGVRHRYQLTK